MNKPVVIHFLSSMRDGGAETLVKDYALLMRECRVIVLTIYPLSTSFANVNILTSAGAECVSIFPKYPKFNLPLIQKLWNRLWYNKYVANRLLSIINETNAVAVHVHMNVLKYVEMISDSIKNIKIFYTCHSVAGRYFNDYDRRREKVAAQRLFKNNYFRLIALHEEMRDELNELFHVNNTAIIKNGVDFNRFKVSLRDKQEVRDKLGISSDTYVVGHIGRYNEMKNHTYLVDIFKELLKIKPNALLLLIGDGPEKKKIVDKVATLQIEHSVLFLSHRTDIPQLLNIMDVFVFPSIFEGLPVSVVEAQVVGLRCVISDSVTSSCFFSPKAIPMSLKESAKKWAEVILNQNIVGPYSNPIEAFDLNVEIKRLEDMYIGR